MTTGSVDRSILRNPLVGLGTGLVVASLLGFLASTNPISGRLLQLVFPVGLGLVVVAYGYRHRSTLADTDSRVVVLWSVASLVYFMLVGIWFFWVSRLVETSFALAVVSSIAAGTLLGVIIGVYALRLHQVNDELAATNQRLATANADLERANDELNAFAGILSHDLRNPLQLASGTLQLVVDSIDETEESDREDADGRSATRTSGVSGEDLRTIETALDRMDTIIEDVLVLTRGTDDEVDAIPVDVGSVAESAWQTADVGDATLEIDGSTRIDADPDLLATLFENLFRNANEHAGDDVTVTVGGLPDESGFYVEDDGVGIPEPDREAVFEMGTGSSDSTGIGLYVVRRVTELHGWDVRVTESADGGARFEFSR